MGFSITGYVLEPPRVGQGNSPYTSTPNNFVNQANPSDVAAYAAAYPTSEANPRDDYMVLVTSEVAPSLAPGLGGGPVAGPQGLLVNAGFGWTKNEIVQRFDYNAHAGRFVPLPGGSLAVLGTLKATPNAQLKVQPVPLQVLAAAPYRLSIGTLGSGLPADSGMTIVLVAADADFTPHGPASSGTVELSLASGNLNWNTTDLTTYAGQAVRWQQQQYFALGKSTGNIGTLTTGIAPPAILLNPIPGTGQSPLIRIGYLPWLTTVEKPDEGHFTAPPSGTVEWALTTGKLNFNVGDVTANAGTPVYYDGTLYERDLTLPRTTIGTVSSPSPITLPIPAAGDVIFCLPNASPYYQFPQQELVFSFSSPGTQGTVQVNALSGAVQFSTPDIGKYGSEPLLVVYGDLDIDHGISIRFFRCVVDLDAQTPVKDVTTIYPVTKAVWASPIIASPLVILPATPVDDDTLQVSVGQGTGTFVGSLNRIDVQNPPAGFGFFINFDTNQFNFGQRTNNVLIPLLTAAGFVQLPDVMVLASNIHLFLETGPNTSVFIPLTPGVDCLVDATPGLVYFATTAGVPLAAGSGGTFSGNTFTDTSANYSSVNVGDFLIVQSGYATGVYTIASVVDAHDVTTDALPPGGSGEMAYEILRGEEILADRFFETVQLVDPLTTVERIRLLGNIQNATILASGQATFPNLTTLSDASANFTTDGIQTGDTITLTALAPSASLTGSSAVTAAAAVASKAFADFPGQALTSFVPPFDAFPQAFSALSARARSRYDLDADVEGGSGLTGTAFIPETVRLVLTSTQTTLTPSVPFTRVTSSPYTITRRLQIPLSLVGKTRFRYGSPTPTNPSGVFSQVVTLVPNDSAFSNPPTMAQGTVEISQSTGNVNFAQVDVNAGGPVYLVWKLTLGVDYTPQPQLSLITFTQRMLQNEEVLLTYVTAPPYTTPPTPPPPPIVGERGTFLVRKELTQPHPAPTSTLFFNPLGKSVATNPAPSVFRGGRPQVTGTQVTINVGTPPSVPSSMTFLPDNILTNALPHGAVVAPVENVYIDYYIYQAMGGESNLTVLNGPMLTAMVVITETTNFVAIPGNQGANFPPGFLLLVNNAEVYQIGTVTYDPVMNQTTLTLSSTQEFQSDQVNPPLAVASGPTPLTAAPLVPAYFIAELQPYLTVPRGMNKVIIPGDRHLSYQTNSVFYFTDTLGSYMDFYLVTGAQYDPAANQTTLTLSSPTQQQYTFGQAILNYSVRPIYTTPPTTAKTLNVPITTQPITVFRRIPGQVGQLLTTPTGYTIDATGTVTYASPLQPEEEFGIFYTGHVIQPAGLRVQASYSNVIAPSQANGLLGQVLNANYTLFAPDSFYWRVETLTNFKGEIVQAIQQAAQSGSPSTGPMTSNTSSTQLFDQGRPSLWFPEGDYANQDLVARACLLFFNTAINYLEDALHAIDGRVVGDHDGRFVFDGVVGRTIPGFPPTGVLNQIDDLIEISPFPLLQPPAISGTYQPIYLAGPFSRFYTTFRNVFTLAPAFAGVDDGQVISQLTWSNINSLPGFAFKRLPRAQVQYPYEAGTSTFIVDTPLYNMNDPLQRPSFTPLMHIVIADAEGNVYVPDSTSNFSVVIGVSATTITISPPCPVAVPQGATIYCSPSDANTALSTGDYPPETSRNGAYGMQYPFGKDVNLNQQNGQVLYCRRSFPFNGFLSGLPIPVFPKSWDIHPVQPGDILEIDGVGINPVNTAPYKFPALFGSTLDDDSNQAIPIVGPTFDGELSPAGGGALNVEAAYEVSGSQFRTGTTTPPYLGTGNLNAGRTTITLTSGFFGTPSPKQYDLVRIMSGTNGQTAWRRITSVTTNSVTVASADAFSLADTNFSFAVAVSSSAVTGTSATLTGTVFTDPNTVFSTINTPIAPTQAFLDGESAMTANAGVASADISSTKKSANASLFGETFLGPYTTIASGSNGVTLPHASIFCLNNSAFPATGSIFVTTSFGVQEVTYTSITGTEFLGCSGGTGTMHTGGTILSSPEGVTATTTSPPARSGIALGWTVVMTSGPNAGLRRQIVGIVLPHTLVLDHAFTSATGGSYRIDNPLNTYNGTVLTQLQEAVATELATISTNANSEQNSLINFFTTIFTNIVGSGNGVVSGTTLTDTTVDFIGPFPSDPLVTSAYLVYIQPPPPATAVQSADMGIYQIGTVTDSHHLTLNQTVPMAGTVTYQVVSIFGTTYTTLASIFTIIVENAAFIASTETFSAIINTTVPVLLSGVADPLEYANGINDDGDDLGDRWTAVAGPPSGGRIAYVNPTAANGPIQILQASLNTSDQLYNKRYTWIDARINLQSGYLALEAQSVSQRIATQAQVFNQLIKLLTVQGS